MKKLLLQVLFLLLILPAMSQNLVFISGTVIDTATGSPIPNHAVTISNDSSGGWTYYQTVYTNNSGLYMDTIPVPLNTQGILYVRTADCQNYLHQVAITYMPSVLNFTVDFAICNASSPCQASFTSQQLQPLTVQFNNTSVGGNNLYQWDFGDGQISNAMNPLHVFGSYGTYSVTLTIGALGTPCFETITQNVYVWDSVAGGCQAAFYTVPDSMNMPPYSYTFFDQSTGSNISLWTWNFGDGSIQTFTYPQNPGFVNHVYAQPGYYMVCLTVQSNDSTCYDMTCDTLAVNGFGGCQAAFVYSIDSLTPASGTVQFMDMSTTSSGYITTWVWSFGDGTSQTVTFPWSPNVTHTYSAGGNYNVCLTIYGSDSTCYDVTCQSITIGSNSGCIANFDHSVPVTTTSPTLFTDLSQASGGAPITSWYWNFGDPVSGVNNVSTIQNPSHTFSTPGAYNVCLTIQGADSSCYDMACEIIYVTGDTTGCQANFSYTADPAPSNHTITFTDLSTGSPTAWFWNFGDGTSSNLQNPVHTFSGPALVHTVCLTITGNNCTSTFCQNVVIQDSVTYHQVYGQVFAGNFPISLGLAMIFSLDTNTNYQPYVAVCPIDSNGIYYFTQVPDGNYYIMAIPMDSNGYLPTYYGNSISWEQATIVVLGTANNPYNISLVPAGQFMSGPGSTSGQINLGDVSTAMMDKINMILMNDQGNAIGFTTVSTAGSFDFGSMAYGTYYLHPEMPGITSDFVVVNITPEKPHADVVMTFSGNKILGIHDEATLANSWSVYPNPVTDHVTLSIDMKQETKAEAIVYNMNGQIVVNTQVTLHDGTNNIGISTAMLPSGIYSLRVSSKEGLILTSKLVKTR